MAALISGGDYAVRARVDGGDAINLSQQEAVQDDGCPKSDVTETKGGKKSETETSANRLKAKAYENNFSLALFLLRGESLISFLLYS